MYIRFRNIPCIVTEDGYVIDSVRDWVVNLQEHRGASGNTINQYVSSVSKFYEYEKEFGEENYESRNDVDRHFNNFLKALRDGDQILGWEAHSRSSELIARNALYSYLAYTEGDETLMKERRTISRFEQAHKKHGMLGYLTDDQPRSKKLKFKRGGKGKKGKQPRTCKYFPPELWWPFYDLIPSHRDKAFFLLLIGTSARVGQALNVWVKDILFDEQKVSFTDPREDERQKELKEKYNLLPDAEISNKGELPGIWMPGPFKEEFFRQAKLYYQKEYVPIGRRLNEHPYFFVTRTGKRLLPQYVRVQFKTIAARLGILDMTPHSLRHLYGYVCAVALDFKIEDIADRMGHASTESTRIYTKIPSRQAEMIFEEKMKKFLAETSDTINEREEKIRMLFKGKRSVHE